MKPKLIILFLVCGTLVFPTEKLSAQDKKTDSPAPHETVRPGVSPGQSNEVHRGQGRDEKRGPGKEDQGVPTPFIGVITRELEPEVRSQTGLQDGHGLLVVEIMPDGPAKEAGLQRHDVLIMLDDQKLVNMEQLQVLVRSQKKGDEITLTIRRAGAEQKVRVRVDERDMPPVRGDTHERGLGFPLPRGGSFRYEPPAGQNRDEWRERAEKFQNELREYQGRVQEWAGGQKGRPMPPPPQLSGPDMPRRDGDPHRGIPAPGSAEKRPEGDPRPRNEQRAESSSSVRVETSNDGGQSVTMHGNVIRTDDSGVYTIRRDNDKTTFTVRTKDGKETTWPINSEQERQAVPQEFRNVLREMDKIHLDGHEAGGRRRELQPAPQPKTGTDR